jgi:hypothetical protein
MPQPNFITDIGKSEPVTDVLTGQVLYTLPRYAAWVDDGRKSQVVETSDDLPMLQAKYGVNVVKLI